MPGLGRALATTADELPLPGREPAARNAHLERQLGGKKVRFAPADRGGVLVSLAVAIALTRDASRALTGR
jgi:hypothetical protein